MEPEGVTGRSYWDRADESMETVSFDSGGDWSKSKVPDGVICGGTYGVAMASSKEGGG